MRKTVALAATYDGTDIDPTWDEMAPENRPRTVGKNLIRVLNNDADPSPCTRLVHETADQRNEEAAQPDPGEAVDPAVSA